MAAPTDIYAIAEMNRRAEEYTLKARSELSRIGCSPEKLKVFRQGPYLQLQYRRNIILADPCGVLMVLKKTAVGLDEEKVWERVIDNVRQVQRQNKRVFGWISAAILGMVVILIFLLTVYV